MTQEWVPVTDRLPEEDGNYLVSKTYHVYIAGEYSRENEPDVSDISISYFDGYSFGDDTVIAWMPLPEPYKRS